MNLNERFDALARIYLEEDRLLTEAEGVELVALAKEAADAADRDPDIVAKIVALQSGSDPVVHAAALEQLPLIRFWSRATSRGIDRIDQVKQVHKLVAQYVLQHFGVPMGEAGIGVKPRGWGVR